MKFSKKVLKNGLRVITVPMQDNPTATVLVLVATGSKYESKAEGGISHFLEHMCFKGTVARPKPIDISAELDGLGSQYNAFTAQEYTGYYAKSDAKHWHKILEVVSDIYLHSTFPEGEIEKEKGVIIEEINMYEDMPHRHVQDLIMQLLYKDQPAGRSITGNKKNILGMKRQDFLTYKNQHYLPSSTLIVVAGKIKEKEVQAEIRRIFADMQKGKKKDKAPVKESQRRPEALVKYKETDQSHFVLAFRAHDIFCKKGPALAVLGGVLGEGMSSRLFQRLREEMGVGYYVRAYDDAYTDHGFFQISAGVDNKRMEEVLQAVLEECVKLKTTKVGEVELDKVKEYLIGNMNLSLESSDDIANFYGIQELLKRELKTPADKAKEIRAVTALDIQNLAKEIFQNNKLNLALIGPFKDRNRFLKLLKF